MRDIADTMERDIARALQPKPEKEYMDYWVIYEKDSFSSFHNYNSYMKFTSYEDAESLVYQLLNKDSQIDGIICGSDKIALGALYAAKRLNKKIPEDILIIGNDHTLFSQLSSISTVSRNRQELAEKACDEIIKMSQDASYKGKSYIVDFHIIERNSTKGE